MSKLKILKQNRRSKYFKEIADLFVLPIAQHRSKNESYKNFLKRFFCLNTRIIQEYIVKTSFKLPGICKVAPNIKMITRGHRKIKEGSDILFRQDKTIPGIVEIEHTCTPGGSPEVFELREIEWIMIKGNLRRK